MVRRALAAGFGAALVARTRRDNSAERPHDRCIEAFSYDATRRAGHGCARGSTSTHPALSRCPTVGSSALEAERFQIGNVDAERYVAIPSDADHVNWQNGERA